jgi:hypothetical protein
VFNFGVTSADREAFAQWLKDHPEIEPLEPADAGFKSWLGQPSGKLVGGRLRELGLRLNQNYWLKLRSDDLDRQEKKLAELKDLEK